MTAPIRNRRCNYFKLEYYARMSQLQIVCLLLAVLALILALAFAVFRLKTSAARKQIEQQPAQAPPPSPSASPAVPASQEEPNAELNARLEAMQRLQEVALGTDTQGRTADAAVHEEIASKVRWTLASITDKPNYAPRRPTLLPKLVQAMNNDDVSRREIGRIIASDPSLAGSLFKLANSPFYRISSEPIESLDRAIALLGMEGMRSLVCAALMLPVFKVDGTGFPKFGEVTWQHTLCSATAAEAHATTLEDSDPFAAQLLALLMGMSTIVVFRVTLDEYLSRRVPADAAAVAILIDSQAAPVARQVAGSWQLSPRIDQALADQSAPHGAKMSSLGRSLQFARFFGALAVLHERKVIDDDAVSDALRTGGSLAAAYERIWARRLELQESSER
jgi:HD-like signal output (HDOD) protein